MNTQTAAASARPSHRPVWVWGVIALVGVAMFLVQHDMGASLKFQILTSVTSFQDLYDMQNLSILFESTSARQIGGLLIGALGAFLIFQHGRTGRRFNGTLAGWLMFFIAWNLLSVTWADDPSVTTRRLILFICMAVGALALAERLTTRDIALLTMLPILVYLVIGFYAEWRNGTLALREPGFRFSGTLHPNEQAINCSLLFFAGWYFFRTAIARRWPYVLIMIFALGMLYMTRSRTALASTIIAFGLYQSLLYSGPRRTAALVGGIATVVGLLLLSTILLPAVQETLTLGRTDVPESFGTLTGRLPLWEQLLEFVAKRPFFGYGYAGFWNEQNSMAVIVKQEWPISHAHNAYLDVLLETGPVGVITFVIILLVGLRLCYLAGRETGDRGYEFFGFILAFGIMNATLESQILQRTLLNFLTMIVLAFVATRAPMPTLETLREPSPHVRLMRRPLLAPSSGAARQS